MIHLSSVKSEGDEKLLNEQHLKTLRNICKHIMMILGHLANEKFI